MATVSRSSNPARLSLDTLVSAATTQCDGRTDWPSTHLPIYFRLAPRPPSSPVPSIFLNFTTHRGPVRQASAYTRLPLVMDRSTRALVPSLSCQESIYSRSFLGNPPPIMSARPPSGGYSLFPNPNAVPPTVRRPASRTRTSESRERSRTRAVSPETIHPVNSASPPRNGRQTPQQRMQTPQESRRPPLGEQQQPPPENRELPALPAGVESPIQRPPPVADVPARSETALSQARTLARSNSNRSRSSIAKLPLRDESSSSSQEPPTIRSIFPQYNPEVPLNQQQYFPTQTSPTHIPRAVINRTTWYPEPEEEGREPQQRSPVRSPMSGGSTQRWPRKRIEPPIIPSVSTNEQMKSMWKVSNGWKASSSEGRVYCMKLSQEKDAPVYTLSSTSQPFYNLRLDPTSASAYVTLSRHDPNKVYKATSPTTSSSASSILGGIVGHRDNGKGSDDKHWQEVLTTTLEEESRKHPPNDGLVALLYPQAAAKMALDRPDDMTAITTAETECARLVWDDDSSSHFLVHPALATPFCVTIERSPAWSRVEYTLEHHESPQHLAKLTRDGTGGGWLEVDTAIASKIDSFFVVDVAVTALMLVAVSDEKNAKVETFEPPPAPREPAGGERRLSKREEKKRAAAAARRGKMEEFEIDVESQDSSFAKLEQVGKETRDRLPWPLRALLKVLSGLFKCFVWVLTLGFKALAAIVKGLARCVGVKSK
ncbi:hypothetical protein CSOJ01_00652 [Colletotrichum sojae]|uniref:Acetylserotonin methytransferase-like protein n=1 Tax=Colletotrichum sojae TaxID=2175907 RepID=A0A8H6JY46_9PEZI|nr:hypothetical protein CSOJ01_00652 [Colletotrichum sojae]